MGDIIANFAGFGVMIYVGIESLFELTYYVRLFNFLRIGKDDNSGTIIGYGDIRTLRRLKKANLYSTIVGFVTSGIFLYQAITKLIIVVSS